MATFQARVEGLTGLTIGTSPTTGELAEYLKDGVIEVTNRIILLRPQDAENYLRESSEQTSNGFNPGSSKIVSVIRESGTNGEWYPCNKKDISLQYKVTDPNSLEYASKYNPVFMVTQNRNVHVYPVPGSSNDGFKVLYVNSSPEETDGTALDHASTGIKWFPEDKVYLVILYAGIRSLNNALSTKADDISEFVEPVATPDYTDANTWINTEEDIEMLQARVGVISAQLKEYASDIQSEAQEIQSKFNKVKSDYEWMTQRLINLMKEYESAFALMAPRPRKEG